MLKKISIIILASSFLFPAFVWATDFYGVCVGVNVYPPNWARELLYAVADAVDMKDALVDEQNWYSDDIELILNGYAEKDWIIGKIEDMPRSHGNTDLFSFSGHGTTDGLVTVDYDYFSPSELQSAFGSNYNQYCCFLDACSTGVFPDYMTKGVICAACEADEWAHEGGGNGNFTYYLLQGLGNNTADPDGHVSAEELHTYAATLINGQTPQLQDNYPGVLNFTPPTTSGTLIDDENWSGTHNVTGDIIVPSGVTLTIDPGTTVEFAANTKLEINGKLTAVGTSSDLITFQSVNGGTAKNQWYGIRFNSGADNTSSIKYATIKNANYAVYLDFGRKPELGYNTMEYNIYGIYGNYPGSVNIHHNTLQYNNFGINMGYSSSPGSIYSNTVQQNLYSGIKFYFVDLSSLSSNDVNHNGNYGLELYNCTIPNMYSNIVKYNDLAGVYLNSMDPGMHGNKIGNNECYGLKLSGADPTMNCMGDGDNVIAENDSHQVYLTNNSVPHLDYGCNDIIKEADWDHIHINSGSTVYARDNWWGDDDSSFFSFYPPGGVVFDPWSHSANTGGLGKALIFANSGPSRTDYARLFAAMDLEHQGHYQEAAEAYRQIIAEYGDNVIARRALSGLVTVTYRSGGDLGALRCELDKIAQSFPGTGFGLKAQVLALKCLELAGDYEGAIAGYQKLRLEEGEAGAMAAFRMGQIVLYGIGDKTRAERLFRELVSVSPKSEAANLARMHLAELPDLPESMGRGVPSPRPQPEMPEGSEVESYVFSLSQNYPNPGNPSTAITFTLPQATHVTLEIYNLLGQRVKTLVEDTKEAGSHSVIWNGRDEFGKVVSSGVYLYRLQAGQGDFVRVRKMLLIR